MTTDLTPALYGPQVTSNHEWGNDSSLIGDSE